MPDGYRLWVNDDRTLMVRLWDKNDELEIATRTDPGAIWGPPVELNEEDS